VSGVDGKGHAARRGGWHLVRLRSQLKPNLCAHALPSQSVLMEGMAWSYLATKLSLDSFLALAWSKGRTELS